MSYEAVSELTQVTTLIYFIAIFLCVLAYALRPSNRQRFDAAARIPLRED